MNFLLIFFVTLFLYLMLSVYLIIVALSEEPIKRYKVLIAFAAFISSLYALGYYFEKIGGPYY